MPHQSVCSGKGVTFETSAIHPTSRAKNIPYQSLGIKTDNRLTRQRKKKKKVILKTILPVYNYNCNIRNRTVETKAAQTMFLLTNLLITNLIDNTKILTNIHIQWLEHTETHYSNSRSCNPILVQKY